MCVKCFAILAEYAIPLTLEYAIPEIISFGAQRILHAKRSINEDFGGQFRPNNMTRGVPVSDGTWFPSGSRGQARKRLFDHHLSYHDRESKHFSEFMKGKPSRAKQRRYLKEAQKRDEAHRVQHRLDLEDARLRLQNKQHYVLNSNNNPTHGRTHSSFGGSVLGPKTTSLESMLAIAPVAFAIMEAVGNFDQFSIKELKQAVANTSLQKDLLGSVGFGGFDMESIVSSCLDSFKKE